MRLILDFREGFRIFPLILRGPPKPEGTDNIRDTLRILIERVQFLDSQYTKNSREFSAIVKSSDYDHRKFLRLQDDVKCLSETITFFENFDSQVRNLQRQVDILLQGGLPTREVNLQSKSSGNPILGDPPILFHRRKNSLKN